MSTTITINSLQRLNQDTQYTNQPNPFDFILPFEVTSNWVFEKKPFTRTTRLNTTDGYKVKACRVMIPIAFVPQKQPMLFLDIKASGIPIIDKTIGPHIKNVNIIGYTGITGCNPFPSELPNYNNTWTLYPHGATDTHYIYESCGSVSIYAEWRGVPLHVRIRDLSGYTLVPPNPPANGYTGFGCMSDFAMTYNVPEALKPCSCSPTFAEEYLNYIKTCNQPRYLSVTPGFAPFFQDYNQVMIILVAEYVEILIEDKCFDK
jgi:hypothetical protein